VEQFDAVVVGARCAGSPLATLLARRGLRVCLLDQARFPSETLSTHVIQLTTTSDPPNSSSRAVSARPPFGPPVTDRARFPR
jgi:choline dehydrogenase-like flavoprotein